MSNTVDAVIIGAGHNGLVAGAYLARAGWSVRVLERSSVAGGCIATEELTLPGFRHDTLSGYHLVWRGNKAAGELEHELEVRGLQYVNTDVPCAGVTPDGASAIMHRDVDDTAAGLPASDRDAYVRELGMFAALGPSIGELLSDELESLQGGRAALRLMRQIGGVRNDLAFGHTALASARTWLSTTFSSDEVKAVLAPWVMHTGMTSDQTGSGLQLLAVAGFCHSVGMPIAVGGSINLVHALVRLIEDHGGEVQTGVDVEAVHVRAGRAAGVRTRDGDIWAERAVVANVTPTQLYGRLLSENDAPQLAVEQAEKYRFGRGDMQIHIALDEPPRWRDASLGAAAVVNITPGLDGMSIQNGQAQAGLLPSEPTFMVGTPTLLDPTRAPDGKAILWMQLQETPFRPRADAAGEIQIDEPGWTEHVTQAYADRVCELLSRHVVNLDSATLARAVITPAQLAARNINCVNGDPYAGSCDMDQSYLFRPLPSYGSHETPVDGLWMVGASTFPGPGLSGASGRTVATELIGRRASRRANRRAAHEALPASNV